MTKQEEILGDDRYISVYDYGFVGLVDVMGDDSTPPQRARTSYGKGTKSVSDDRNLLRYLIRHKHNTPVEMVELVFHLKLPIFVMRQHVRHRTSSMNEYSARYSEMSNEFYLPYHEDIFFQDNVNNKQGSIEDSDLVELNTKNEVQNLMSQAYEHSFGIYEKLLQNGLAREMARSVLPVSNYTECFWKVNLHNFFHYSNLRRDSHAQKQIRDHADPMFELVKRKLPIACEAFNDYIFEAETFSRMEMNILRRTFCHDNWILLHDAMGGPDGVIKHFGLTKREYDELKIKIGIDKQYA